MHKWVFTYDTQEHHRQCVLDAKRLRGLCEHTHSTLVDETGVFHGPEVNLFSHFKPVVLNDDGWAFTHVDGDGSLVFTFYNGVYDFYKRVDEE